MGNNQIIKCHISQFQVAYDIGIHLEHTDTKEQVGLSEDSNYLFNSINKHQYFSAQFEQTTLQEKKRWILNQN